MGAFTGGQAGHTPSLTQDNWCLDANAANKMGQVTAIGWGGRLTTPVGYRTRWTRPTTIGSSTHTPIASAIHGPLLTVAPLLLLGTYVTAPVLATDPGGNLHSQDWNAFGGLGFVNLPIDTPWWLINAVLTGQISCRNVAGVDVAGSSYEVSWKE